MATTKNWKIRFLKEATEDIDSLGTAEARRILNAIYGRLQTAPDQYGDPLRSNLAGCRRIRVGDCRVIYRVNQGQVEVVVIAAGPRRDEEVYSLAASRV